MDGCESVTIYNHEHVYPFPDGEGGAGDPIAIATDAADETNGAATTKDYWGEPEIIIPPSTLTGEWNWTGMNISGTTTNKSIRSKAYKICPQLSTTRNAGNAWTEGATILTVADGSLFLVNDLVWIVSDYVQGTGQGELQKVANVAGNVVTIVREGSQFGAANTGIRWDHAGNEKMYLVERANDFKLHGFEFDFACASAKDFVRFNWHLAKQVGENCGIIVRAINSTDGTNATTYDCTAITEDL